MVGNLLATIHQQPRMEEKQERTVARPTLNENIYTVDDVISKMGFGPFQLLLTIFCGLLWLTDAMEFMIISVLSPAVKCQWGLSTVEEAMITSVVFLGFFVGGLFWGVIFDVVGRKTGLFLVNIIILVFGVLSALKISSSDSKIPGYPWLLFCRCGVGFGAGGAGQSVTYYAEFLPQKTRGFFIGIGSVWWSIGSMLAAVLAIGVMGHGSWGWHWYLGLAAVPLGPVLFVYPIIPESARYYLVKGETDKAHDVIKRVARINRKPMPLGRLVSQEEKDRVVAEQDVVFYSEEAVTILDSPSVVMSSYVASEQEENNPMEVDGLQVQLDSEEHPIIAKSSQHRDILEQFLVSQEEKDRLVPEQDMVLYSEETVDSPSVVMSGNHDEEKNPVEVDGLQRRLLDSEEHPIVAKSSQCRYGLEKLNLVFVNGMWKTTGVLLVLWLGVAWLYYGIVLLTTTLLQYDPHCGVEEGRGNSTANFTSACEGNLLDTQDYVRILWTTAAELPGMLVTVVIIELLGRKLTMTIEFVACMIGFLLLFICGSETLLTFFLFIIRAFTSGVFQAIFVYTPEVYPTNTRAFGMGICTASARIGAIVTPYVAQVLLHVNDYATISLYAGSSLLLAVLAMALPIETKGRALKDTGKAQS